MKVFKKYSRIFLFFFASPLLAHTVNISSVEDENEIDIISGAHLSFEEVSDSIVLKAKPIIEKEMSIYSKKFIDDNIDNIFIVKNLRINNFRYGGAYNNRSIFISVFDIFGFFLVDEAEIIDTLHHEIASFFLIKM